MKVGFIGVGNMGYAIMKQLFQNGFIKPYDSMIFDTSVERTNMITEQYPVKVAESNIQITKESDTVLIAVKPNFMRAVLADVQKVARGKRIISIAAGWTMNMLKDALGWEGNVQILRVMPNTPAMIGSGYTALCEETTFTNASLNWAKELFSCLGIVQIMPERLFDAVTAVSGSSPAYVYMFIEALADGAVKHGMPRNMAIQAAAQAVFGSAKMVIQTGSHPAKLKDDVCSPGGTTIEAVATLEKCGFRSAIIEAMDACAQKNKALATSSLESRRIK